MKRKFDYAFVFIVIFLSLIFFSTCKDEDPARELKPLLEKYIEVWNTGNVEELANIIVPDFELRMTPKFEPVKGIDSIKKDIIHWRTAYPDFHIRIDEEIYTKEKIAVQWLITATNTGWGMFPPTGRKIEVPGVSIFHVFKGKLKDEWIFGDNLLWMQQLGYKLIPPSNEE